MNTRQNEAIERLRRCYEGNESIDQVYGERACEDNPAEDLAEMDEQVVSRAYFAEHPADDDKPVTVGWLESIGWDKKDSNNWPCKSLVVNGVNPWDYAGIAWRGAGVWLMPFNVALCLAITRGDVRRLCAALGIELEENE